jgi:hypothetical protein
MTVLLLDGAFFSFVPYGLYLMEWYGMAIQGQQSKSYLQLIRQSGITFLMILPRYLQRIRCIAEKQRDSGPPLRPAPEAVVKWDQLNPVRGFSKLKAVLSGLNGARLLVGLGRWSCGRPSPRWNQLSEGPAGPLLLR